MFRLVVFVGTDVSEERIASIIRETRMGELGETLAVVVFLRSVLLLLVTAKVALSSPILLILMLEAICCTDMSVLNRATRRNILDDSILHSHRRENLKSYVFLHVSNKCTWVLLPV
jgi:hypothetical protein